MEETDILIAGAGIAGSALACALRDSGLRTLVVDRTDGPLDTARGDHLQPRSCEILQRWGVLDDFVAAGAGKREGASWNTADGRCILRTAVTGLDIPHPYFLYVNHETIARLFLDAAQSAATTAVLRPIRNWWLEDDDGESRIVRIGLADGRDRRVRATLVVGADGRNSRLRRAAGIAATTHAYERGIAVLFATPCFDNPGNDLQVFVDATTTSAIPRADGRCKIGVPVAREHFRRWRNADAGALAAELRLLAPGLAIDSPRLADIYAPVQLQADRWTVAGAVIVGDACHALHPARSQGMNIAIRCVDRLAGLLQSVDSRPARRQVTAVLAEYEQQMKPVVDGLLRDNHAAALQMDDDDPDCGANVIESLEALARDPGARRRYALRSAGYETQV